MKRFLFSSAAIAVAAGSAWWLGRYEGAKASPGEIGTVQRTDLAQQITVAGTLLPNRRTIFVPTYNGYLKKLHVKLGDRVKAGDPIVTLAQSLAREEEEEHPMRAPFAGTVVQVLRSEGEWIEMNKDNSPMVRIDDLSRLFVVSDVPENDIAKLRVGQTAIIKANSVLDKTYKGIIRYIAVAAKEKKEWSRSAERVEFEVRLEIVDADKDLRPGLSAMLDIVTDNRTKVLALAQEYVEREGPQYYVTLVTGEKRTIEVGIRNEELFEIKKGLVESDRVKRVDFSRLPAEVN